MSEFKYEAGLDQSATATTDEDIDLAHDLTMKDCQPSRRQVADRSDISDERAENTLC